MESQALTSVSFKAMVLVIYMHLGEFIKMQNLAAPLRLV